MALGVSKTNLVVECRGGLIFGLVLFTFLLFYLQR